MKIEKNTFLCCLESDKMSRSTLATNLKQVLHKSQSKYDLDENFVRMACDVRRVVGRVVVLHLALY